MFCFWCSYIWCAYTTVDSSCWFNVVKMITKALKQKIKVDKIGKMKMRNQCTKKLKKHCGKEKKKKNPMRWEITFPNLISDKG